ncbi:SGNH/GDSL hydrolase family protein [Roseomonas sp. AR75]|uniref:SGNH/GDSL hydrolase family protein n=1 Tax=Roseomonas sp. AR75 TaxID=2562311 RepID=UPI0014854A4B|nr:SGNH/GDSL hydrolase family protein [Roseomonas sp. AR75]
MMRRFVQRVVMLGLIAAAPLVARPAEAGYAGVYAFGDSLTDRGNLFLATAGAAPVAPYAAGQFTNGNTWTDRLSQRLGLGSSAPSLAGGNVYAYGLAQTTTATPPPPLPPSFGTFINLPGQVASFLVATGGAAPSNALYAVWAGSNDMLQTLLDASVIADPVARAIFVNNAIATSVSSLLGQLQALEDAGARNFLVLNLPDLGKTPRLNGDPLSSAAGTGIAAAFNTALASGLAAFDAQQGVRVLEVDTFDLINRAVANPGAFGLTNATDACLVGGPVNYTVTNPANLVCSPGQQATSLFFDDLHPSAAAHLLIADTAMAAIPAPGAVGLLLVGMAGLMVARRRPAAGA